jgi:hypothetical protein
MGKKSSGKKGGATTKTRKTSSGMRRVSRAKRELYKVQAKLKRWERNQSDPKKEQAGKSRNGWNTAGLQKRASQLQEIIKKGRKVPKVSL